MKTCKKLIMVFVLIAMVIVASVPVSALPAEKTTQQKADALNSIKIITGTNGEYSLGSSIRRSEAITYMVRLIGKADDVVKNKNLYSITPFTDVASNQWYAPYIGYCADFGLIPKNSTKFNPLGYITEREFVTLMLTALEYKEGTDFTADTAFEKAKDIGLTNLTYYVNHLKSNGIASRSGAVDLLYSALTLKCKSGEKFLYQKLIDEGAATRKQLTAAGFIEDKPVTEISQINTLDLNKLEIKFNEKVTLVSGVKIYAKDNALDVLGCSIQSLSGDTLTIVTSSIDVSKEYVVEVTGVQDESENVVDLVQKSFRGFEAKVVASDFFRISKIEPVNDKSIKVYFTHPVTVNSEVCLYYSITSEGTTIADGKQGDIKAGVFNSEKNAVLVTLNSGSFSGNALYTLNIEGNMMSAYGVKMNNGLGDSMKFIAGSSQDSAFELDHITTMDKRTVLLAFSKEVNSFLAKQVFNFYLTDENNNPIRINSTAINDTGKGVYLNIGQDMEKNKKYYITVNNLNDITKQQYITEQKYSFQADYGTTEAFTITGINVIDNQTIEFYFNKPLDAESASKPSYYSVNRWGSYSGIIPEKVLYNPDENPYMVKLYLPKSNCLGGQYDYEIRINSSMKDYLGNSVSVTGIRFTGSSQQKADIAIKEIVPVSTDSVRVSFTKEMSFTAANLMPSNFSLEYTYNKNSIRKIPVSVIYADAKTLVLKFDALEYSTAYKVRVQSLTDYMGSIIKGLEKSFELKPN